MSEWNNIFEEFKEKHPELCEGIIKYRPYSYMDILIIYENGKEIEYDYTTKECKVIKSGK